MINTTADIKIIFVDVFIWNFLSGYFGFVIQSFNYFILFFCVFAGQIIVLLLNIIHFMCNLVYFSIHKKPLD